MLGAGVECLDLLLDLDYHCFLDALNGVAGNEGGVVDIFVCSGEARDLLPRHFLRQTEPHCTLGQYLKQQYKALALRYIQH